MRKVSLNKISTSLETILFKNTLEIVGKFVPEIKQKYLETYEDLLLSSNIDEDSLANPKYFYEEYSSALDDFEYVIVRAKGEVAIIVPDIDNFEFKGRLVFLQWLTSGIVGTYYELSRSDYEYLLNYDKLSKQLKSVLIDLPGFMGDDTSDLDFYLVDASLNAHKIFQNILKKTLVLFPFSNIPAIDIFDEGKEFFNGMKDSITNNIIEKSLTDLKRSTY